VNRGSARTLADAYFDSGHVSNGDARETTIEEVGDANASDDIYQNISAT
jgi:hypothetical protein